MEHGSQADARPVAGWGAPGDDTARFLRELRQLRNGAGLGHAELAARAHYPYDSIKAAEVGPSLPDLPVLSAFVRGCGGTTEEWEERWRSLTKSPSLPVSGARQAVRSEAADAGARLGAAPQDGDSPDPSVIIAALNRVAVEMATPGADVPPPPVAQAVPSPLPPPPAGQPGGAGKPNGWDPIRVSSAWPTLKEMPALAEPVRGVAPAGGAGVPWDNALRTGHSTGASAGSAPGRRSLRITLVVVAVALLCVVAALLAIFG